MPASFDYIMPSRRPSALSTSSTLSQKSLAGRVRDLVSTPKVAMDIRLDREHTKHTYSTMDRIQGVVSITAPNDTRFDDVEIHFLGQANTFVERLGVVAAHNGRTEAYHQFLKLVQPISRSSYPTPRVLQAGETYEFPFTFNVPEHLLLGACRHKVINNKLRDAHLQLPPTLGNPESLTPGVKALDDMAPDMVRILYGIRVRLIQNRDKDGKEQLLGEKYRKLRIIPAYEEQPPLTLDNRDVEFCLRKEKGIRKGMFKGKIGRLVMEASQPRSLHLPSPSSKSAPPATTSVTVLLRFDPSDSDTQPPRLGSLNNKIRAHTYYSTSTMHDYPSKATILYDYTRGCHIESVNLSARNMASVPWHRQEPGANPRDVFVRRDSTASVTSTSPCPDPSATYTPEKPFYVAEFLVPITLPADKSFAPSFHSCLASRLYVLDLSLSVPTPSGSGVGTTVTLKIPVQVSSQRSDDADNPNSPLSDAEQMAAYEAEAQQAAREGEDYFFAPRSVAPPPDEYIGTSDLGQMLDRQRHGSVSTMGRGSVSTQGRGSVAMQGRGSMSAPGRGGSVLAPDYASISPDGHSTLITPIHGPSFQRPSVSTVHSTTRADSEDDEEDNENATLSPQNTNSNSDSTVSPTTTIAPAAPVPVAVVGAAEGQGQNITAPVGAGNAEPPEYSFLAPRGSVPVCG